MAFFGWDGGGSSVVDCIHKIWAECIWKVLISNVVLREVWLMMSSIKQNIGTVDSELPNSTECVKILDCRKYKATYGKM
jgi:hypothetical protein